MVGVKEEDAVTLPVLALALHGEKGHFARVVRLFGRTLEEPEDEQGPEEVPDLLPIGLCGTGEHLESVGVDRCRLRCDSPRDTGQVGVPIQERRH